MDLDDTNIGNNDKTTKMDVDIYVIMIFCYLILSTAHNYFLLLWAKLISNNKISIVSLSDLGQRRQYENFKYCCNL